MQRAETIAWTWLKSSNHRAYGVVEGVTTAAVTLPEM